MSYPFSFAFDTNELDRREMIDCEPIIFIVFMIQFVVAWISARFFLLSKEGKGGMSRSDCQRCNVNITVLG
jgi:hypothetical protein